MKALTFNPKIVKYYATCNKLSDAHRSAKTCAMVVSLVCKIVNVQFARNNVVDDVNTVSHSAVDQHQDVEQIT